MIRVDETEPIGELEAKFPYRDVQIKRGVDMKQFYDLEAEIGRGKFGTVYLCREKATTLALAAKFVGIQRRQDRKNVEREVEIMRTLQHPRLIQLYDAFESENTMVVILELIEGGELFERVIGDDFILTEKACTIFMRQICEGVAFIHKNNIIHLDLKPENILCLTKTGNRIKIIDFGLARYYEPGSKLQVLFGTPEFVAPEVVNFDQISPATDMWSVGVICYVLLSGLSPFMGDTDVETMTNVTLSRYDFDDESFDSISDNAKDFITNLLLNNKEARLTAEQCLVHPWLKKTIPPPPPELITTKDNLRTYVDSYHNINVIADNEGRIITPKPSSMSAVELIAASDKEFMNRDGIKSFSNISNENILPPNRYPVIVTNNNVPTVIIDNNLAVTGAPTTNDDVLNMMNANIPSMPSPPVLDNASTAPPNIPLEPESVAYLNQIVRVDESEMKNNNVRVATNTNEIDSAGGNEEVSASISKADGPPRVITTPSVPVALLPFISKSLPAAAAMLDESLVNQMKPVHFPHIPSLPTPDIEDEPIIAHPPVIGTTIPPPKRGSIDIETGLPKLENMAAKRGSIDVISLIQKRGAVDADVPQPKRQSICLEEDRAAIEAPVQEPQTNPADPGKLKLSTPIAHLHDLETEPNAPVIENLPDTVPLTPPPSPVLPLPPTLLLPDMHAAPDSQVSSQPEIPSLQATIPANEPSLAEIPPLSPLVSQDVFPIVSSSPVEPARVTAVVSPPILQPMEDVFVPQPPPIVKASPPLSDIPSSGVRSPEHIPSPLFRNIAAYHSPSPPEKPSSPYFSTSQLPRSSVSPISSLTSPPRRESPLQKQLDEIPNLSSEILSSLKNMPSLSRTTSYESSSSTGKRTSNVAEPTGYKTYERVTSPRVVSFTEHTSSFTSVYTPKTYTKSPSTTVGKTTSEDKSTSSHVSSRNVSSTNTTIKRSEMRETESSRQTASKKEPVTKTALTAKQEADALAFKQKLRSTTPWFSERKAEPEKSIEKKSSDITNLLSELGPLERSPWAREIRKISAKLVEMSKDTTARKQLEEEHIMKMNEQQTARRQKFKVSVLNRDVVFGTAREFYIGGEVSGSSPLKEQQLRKQQETTSSKVSTQQTTSSKVSVRTSRLSPEKKPTRPSSAFKMPSK